MTPFRSWFRCGYELEPNPAAREFCEELGPKEYGLLTISEAQRVTFKFLKHCEHSYYNQRTGRKNQVIGRGFFCIYEAGVPIDLQRKLVLLSMHPLCPLKFVTIQEVADGQTSQGVKIADICDVLV